ncbi:hypothetical protein MGG_06052 [Pyricularia oryzae 70-15]|uniref:Mitochondrial K+-H+ exchange-related-domain-containing protein n=1 Tax=Pyricularia oryzae (strain 70-15 / ATCC MYA-4617 / FGSC 8958) TaxID=242507 RepID=G4N4Y3_PYRO7|nr:uncharacterized protein MGG_06052 [Pyricularia oryzae 70-15]EHA52095.1 hypothetical protein MGG_06052 [Pyricularia oryzae 70-15]KAI7925896.1 hypothetical protein M0657_004006 [Pyricularia oryzae]KAI7928427.1 hypothetical protein M9X92_001813 [Pyricularia oryzae]
MRFFLLPVSTRRTLLYCQRAPAIPKKQTISERVQSKAARTWADWEKKPGGWQKLVVGYGNQALRRIPYEEWGLKSVPPLSTARKEDEQAGKVKVEVVYPKSLVKAERVTSILHTLSTGRESLHKKRLVLCFLGMPLTIPVAIIPIVPNIPFFYLVYRAWSHWRALAGGRHIQFLLQNKLITPVSSPVLDQVYADQDHPLPSTAEPTTTKTSANLPESPIIIEHPSPEEAPNYPGGETLLLSQENAQRITRLLGLPQLEVEIERAIWQVETAIAAQNSEKDGKASEPQPEGGAPSPPPASVTEHDKKQ